MEHSVPWKFQYDGVQEYLKLADCYIRVFECSIRVVLFISI